jgi:hypothetical protein
LDGQLQSEFEKKWPDPDPHYTVTNSIDEIRELEDDSEPEDSWLRLHGVHYFRPKYIL